MRKHLRAAAVMVGVMASGGAWADTDVEDLDPTELPAPVAARLGSAFPSATLAEVKRWGGGFEATLIDGIRRQEVLLDAMGNVVERHVPIAVKELPADVRATLSRPQSTAN